MAFSTLGRKDIIAFEAFEIVNRVKPNGSCLCGYLCSDLISGARSSSFEECSICQVEFHVNCLERSSFVDKTAPKFCPLCLLKTDSVEDFNSAFWTGRPLTVDTWELLRMKYRNIIDNVLNDNTMPKIEHIDGQPINQAANLMSAAEESVEDVQPVHGQQEPQPASTILVVAAVDTPLSNPTSLPEESVTTLGQQLEEEEEVDWEEDTGEQLLQPIPSTDPVAILSQSISNASVNPDDFDSSVSAVTLDSAVVAAEISGTLLPPSTTTTSTTAAEGGKDDVAIGDGGCSDDAADEVARRKSSPAGGGTLLLPAATTAITSTKEEKGMDEVIGGGGDDDALHGIGAADQAAVEAAEKISSGTLLHLTTAITSTKAEGGVNEVVGGGGSDDALDEEDAEQPAMEAAEISSALLLLPPTTTGITSTKAEGGGLNEVVGGGGDDDALDGIGAADQAAVEATEISSGSLLLSFTTGITSTKAEGGLNEVVGGSVDDDALDGKGAADKAAVEESAEISSGTLLPLTNAITSTKAEGEGMDEVVGGALDGAGVVSSETQPDAVVAAEISGALLSSTVVAATLSTHKRRLDLGSLDSEEIVSVHSDDVFESSILETVVRKRLIPLDMLQKIADEAEQGIMFLSLPLRFHVLLLLGLDFDIWVEMIQVRGDLPPLRCHAFAVVFGSVVITKPDIYVGDVFPGDFVKIGVDKADESLGLRSNEDSIILCFSIRAPCEVTVNERIGSNHYRVSIAGVPQDVYTESGIAARDIELFDAVAQLLKFDSSSLNASFAGVSLCSLEYLQHLWKLWSQESTRRRSRKSSRSHLEFMPSAQDGRVQICSVTDQNGPPEAVEFWFTVLRDMCAKFISVSSSGVLLAGFDFIQIHHSCIFHSTMLSRSESPVQCFTVVSGKCLLVFVNSEGKMSVKLFPGAAFVISDFVEFQLVPFKGEDCAVISARGNLADGTVVPKKKRKAREIQGPHQELSEGPQLKKPESEKSHLPEVQHCNLTGGRSKKRLADHPARVSDDGKDTPKKRKPSSSIRQPVREFCRGSENFFSTEISSLVYQVVNAEDFSTISPALRNLHAVKPVASGPHYQLFTRRSGFINPKAPVWSPSLSYAPILVSCDKKGGRPDWRFTLGFGQKFDLGSSTIHHYCAGFIYSSESNRHSRTMLTYLALTKKATSSLSDKKLVESIKQFPFRLLRISDIMGTHVPVIVGEINDLDESSATRVDFFRSVRDLFSPGGTLPSVYNISCKEAKENAEYNRQRHQELMEMISPSVAEAKTGGSSRAQRDESTPKNPRKAPSTARKARLPALKGIQAANNEAAHCETGDDDFAGGFSHLADSDVEGKPVPATAAEHVAGFPLLPPAPPQAAIPAQSSVSSARVPVIPSTPTHRASPGRGESMKSTLEERLYERIALKEAALQRQISEIQQHQQQHQEQQRAPIGGASSVEISSLDMKLQQLERALFESRAAVSEESRLRIQEMQSVQQEQMKQRELDMERRMDATAEHNRGLVTQLVTTFGEDVRERRLADQQFREQILRAQSQNQESMQKSQMETIETVRSMATGTLGASIGVMQNLVETNQKQLEVMGQMSSGYQRALEMYEGNQHQLAGSLQRSIQDNSRTADSLNSQYNFLRGATLALVDNRGGRSQPVFTPDGNVVQELNAFQVPQSVVNQTQRRLPMPSLSSLTPPPSQRHPDSPFQPIQFGSAATSVTSPPSAVSISQGSQVDTEALGRFFAAQNPEVLQQLLQFVYSNVTPTPK